MHPESRLLLFELDPEFASHLQQHFHTDPRVIVLNADAGSLSEQLLSRVPVTYVTLRGVPFSTNRRLHRTSAT